MYDQGLKSEAEEEELGGKIQQAYANYMKAKIAYMTSKGQAVYPDANSTLRVDLRQNRRPRTRRRRHRFLDRVHHRQGRGRQGDRRRRVQRA